MKQLNSDKKTNNNAARAAGTLLLLLLFLGGLLNAAKTAANASPSQQQQPATSKKAAAAAEKDAKQQADQPLRLSCQPGEIRLFSYESNTQVWGHSAGQRVKLSATLRVRCMEAPNNATLRYLVDIQRLEPSFESDSVKAPEKRSPSSSVLADGIDARAEPVFEEVVEAASRMQKSVSGWFTRTWATVRDFFSSIFTNSASDSKQTIGAEEAFRDGIDLSGQCRAKRHKGSSMPKLPIDESIFDDLDSAASSNPSFGSGGNDNDDESINNGAKFYSSASSSSGIGAVEIESATDGTAPDAQPVDFSLSFFDDPRPDLSAAATSGVGGHRSKRSVGGVGASQQPLVQGLRLPFEFTQTRAGRILDVRFGADDTDISVRNFKRHIADLFATNLQPTSSSATTTSSAITELTPVGSHSAQYTHDSDSAGSAAIKRLLAADSSLAKTLAFAGMGDVVALATAAVTSDESRNQATPNGSQADGGERLVTLMRTINSTNDLAAITSAPPAMQSSYAISKAGLGGDASQLQVRVRQLQQIATGGRLVRTAGQLSVALVRDGGGGGLGTSQDKFYYYETDGSSSQSSSARLKASRRERNADDAESAVDVAEYLQISTAFSVQLVPAAPAAPASKFAQLRRPSTAANAKVTGSASLPRTVRSTPTTTKPATTTPTTPPTNSTKPNSDSLVRRPTNSRELAETLDELRKLETRLRLSTSSLLAESTPSDGLAQRLEVVRDQVAMRLNEEYMRNVRSVASSQAATVARNSAGALGEFSDAVAQQPQTADSSGKSRKQSFGLALTQIILNTGITGTKRGSIYERVEEALDLEAALGEDSSSESLTKLLRNTLKVDKLRSYCSAEVAYKTPVAQMQRPGASSSFRDKTKAVDANQLQLTSNKLRNCRQVLQLLLRVSDARAIQTTLGLIDLANQKLVAVAKTEELGYGPAGRHLRRVRQQFVELLASVGKPTNALLDSLVARLHYSKLLSAQQSATTTPTKKKSTTESEFTLVAALNSQNSDSSSTAAPKWQQQLLKEEDDANNNDGDGSLVMSLTQLAARPSISRSKKVDLAEKLLLMLKNSTCSPFNEPDLDILEAFVNFNEPLDEVVGKIVHLARRCKHRDQYVVACVHALQAQLRNSLVQRWFSELIKSNSSSCMVKSEVVLTLNAAVTVQELAAISGGLVGSFATNSTDSQLGWPAAGRNALDELLADIVTSAESNGERAATRRCLTKLVEHYFARKRPTGPALSSAPDFMASAATSRRSSRKTAVGSGPRRARDVESAATTTPPSTTLSGAMDKFWDSSACKKWLLYTNGTLLSLHGKGRAPTVTNVTALLGNPLAGRDHSESEASPDSIDELDDSSLLHALLSSSGAASPASNRARHLKLVEREAPDSGSDSGAGTTVASATLAAQKTAIIARMRHKCSAQKTFGAKNAEATLSAEVVNDLVGPRDENKFLSRFQVSSQFLGNKLDVGRMYFWHQKRTTRAYVNIMGRTLWDTAHSCNDKTPHHLIYMPMFDFNVWLVKLNFGVRLYAEMGFQSACNNNDRDSAPTQSAFKAASSKGKLELADDSVGTQTSSGRADDLDLAPRILIRASGEAAAKFVVARVGMSLASHYSYEGRIRVNGKSPAESCMSVVSGHAPMNVTFSSWYQLFDNDCLFWGSRGKAEPSATKWRLSKRKASAWIENECLAPPIA